MSRLSVSIVIPTCQRVADLERCLEILVPQLPADGSCELVVSDDGNVKKTEATLAAKFPAVRWTQGPRRGPAANRNHGASETTGEWLLFLDDDLVPSPDFVTEMVKSMGLAADESILEACIVNDEKPRSLLWEAPHSDIDYPRLTCSAAFCIRRSTFDGISGFDNRYENGVYHEDIDFSARLLAIGARKKFVRTAVVTHPFRRVPEAKRLARRWEGKCVFAFDQGASSLRVLWGLPWHALRVIQSRFRDKPLNAENAKAFGLFVAEWLWVLWLTPGWVAKWAKRQRSPFWCEWVSRHGPAPKYGF
jgi:glycosyltransferase involved in cell wall biosynthesis